MSADVQSERGAGEGGGEREKVREAGRGADGPDAPPDALSDGGARAGASAPDEASGREEREEREPGALEAKTEPRTEPKSEARTDEPAGKAEAPRPRRRWVKRLAVLGGVTLVSGLGLWIAIHRVEWLGPALADGARAVLGNDAVAGIEEFAYGVEDHVNRVAKAGDAPEAYWDVPAALTVASAAAPAEAAPTASAKPARPAFAPANVGPMHTSWTAPGDGVWVPIPDPRRPGEPSGLMKTLLHPDRSRSWSAVSVVAVDLRAVELHFVLGRFEPKALDDAPKEAKEVQRPAVIDPAHHPALLAAFNGGFKTTHGKFGAMSNGITVVPAKTRSCTIVKTRDGAIDIASWPKVESGVENYSFFRQTPGCMIEEGKIHPGLTIEGNKDWGSTIDGETVIRRSAIGISKDKGTLFVGIGDAVTAPAMARSMEHAGAENIAQLDVNWSYPKFMLFEPKEGGAGPNDLVGKPLCKGFEFTEDDYIRDRNHRDFFYLTRKD